MTIFLYPGKNASAYTRFFFITLHVIDILYMYELNSFLDLWYGYSHMQVYCTVFFYLHAAFSQKKV